MGMLVESLNIELWEKNLASPQQIEERAAFRCLQLL